MGRKDKNILAKLHRPESVQISKSGLQWDNNFATWSEVQLSQYLDSFEIQTTTETMTSLVSKTYLTAEEEDSYLNVADHIFEEGDGNNSFYYLDDSEISALQCTSLTDLQYKQFAGL